MSGLTVVTGQNNSGKTAMVRAVRGVFENSGGDAFVRHGTDALAVHLDFGDTDITWTKGPKVKPTYVIGGKTINPGRAVPDEVRSLGVQPVQAGSGEVWPQIAPQFTGQMFLLDMPGSAIAEVVSDVDRVSKLTEALRYADSDKRSANADLKIRRKDRDDAQAEVQRFDGLDAAADVWATACAARDAVQAVANELDDARAVAERLAVAQARVAALEGVCRVLVPVTQPVVDASANVAIVRRLASVVRQHRDAIASSSCRRSGSIGRRCTFTCHCGGTSYSDSHTPAGCSGHYRGTTCRRCRACDWCCPRIVCQHSNPAIDCSSPGHSPHCCVQVRRGIRDFAGFHFGQ